MEAKANLEKVYILIFLGDASLSQLGIYKMGAVSLKSDTLFVIKITPTKTN